MRVQFYALAANPRGNTSQYILEPRLGGLQSRFRSCGEEKNLLPGIEPRPVARPTEIFWNQTDTLLPCLGGQTCYSELEHSPVVLQEITSLHYGKKHYNSRGEKIWSSRIRKNPLCFFPTHCPLFRLILPICIVRLREYCGWGWISSQRESVKHSPPPCWLVGLNQRGKENSLEACSNYDGTMGVEFGDALSNATTNRLIKQRHRKGWGLHCVWIRIGWQHFPPFPQKGLGISFKETKLKYSVF